ncbi:GPI ethanolamine phosphate transferase 2 isoform X2 [Carica papaya]|nr:GPI ethanolamine phosphate transferase 2 isoform X2 [Carica papaya]
MVIDGLPAEFVLGKDGQPPKEAFRDSMPYTQSLLANGVAVGYHAKAAPPTVTMPRLKAMVSGAIGGFLDVAFNFNTQALLDDNLLDQFFRVGWQMVMLGDDTWLKLFPGLFKRHDGVNSFYVKDTVQVDQNVSRHLADELLRDDWNLLILHYLGLDHVGHIGGRNSNLMAPKLKEMDEVVRMIHLHAIQAHEGDKGQKGHTLLMVVSDHGMTDNGNHGGSSYEETDSLVLLIGLENLVSDHSTATDNAVYQVDIAPTLALLFGVPIPKNNVGVLISKTLDSLKDEQQLRALELNSWQLFRLLQAQIPGLSYGEFKCSGFTDGQDHVVSTCNGRMEAQFCCLYKRAAFLHSSWKSKKSSKSNTKEEYSSAVAAYYEFLKTSSEWLSRKTTDKPVHLLAFGVATMFLSCLILLSEIHWLRREVYLHQRQQVPSLHGLGRSNLEERFILGVIFFLVISMGSSSMVEEEHYIWHFFILTFFLLLLRKTSTPLVFFKRQNGGTDIWISSVFVLLISGRILRGWHQGGVNWTNLPDISKWLEQSGSGHIKLIQLVSVFLVTCLGLFPLLLVGSKRFLIQVVGFSFLISGFLVFLHVLKNQYDMFASSYYDSNLSVQIVYASLGLATFGTFVVFPWLIPSSSSRDFPGNVSISVDIQNNFPWVELRNSLYVIGSAYILSWCLLQLVLQQPVNSVPILLLLVQLLAIMLCFSHGRLHLAEWVEVATLYFLGMAGHFALGNSNTLATIDVAAAFIGISSHSTLLSGILMFMITYASPMLILLSLVMYVSVKDTGSLPIPQYSDSGFHLKMMLAFPCLVPLGINSVVLTAYTLVLLLMRNHLFVWSVFSPKYLYVCATTVCTYIGVCVVAATGMYTYLVLAIRRKRQVKCLLGETWKTSIS